MKNRILAFTGLIALLGSTSAFAVFAQGTPPVTPTPGTMRPGHAKREKHPEMVKALRELEAAARTLKAANHDFGGHRETALDLTTKAIAEVKLGIQSDKN